MKRVIMDAMNDSFHKANDRTTGCWHRFWLDLQARGLGVLQLFGRSRGMWSELEVARQKRLLERRLLAQGFSRKLALIAVATAFAEPAKP